MARATASAPRCGVGPWSIVSACLLLQSIGGLFYMFAVFSGELKNRSWVGGLGPNNTLTQGQLTLVGTASNIGGNLGLPVGLFMDRFGLVWSLLVGAVVGGGGWALMYAMLFVTAVAWPFWPLLVAGLLQGNAQIWTDVCVITTMARVFPAHRGVGIGLAKSFVGLSGSLATQIYTGFYKPHIVPFILFIAIVFAVICVIGASVLGMPLRRGRAWQQNRHHQPTPEQRAAAFTRTNRAFYFGYAMTVLLAASAVALAVLEQFDAGAGATMRMSLTGVMLAIFAALLGTLVVFDFACGGVERYAAVLGAGQTTSNHGSRRGGDGGHTDGAGTTGGGRKAKAATTASDELVEPMLSSGGSGDGDDGDLDEYQALAVAEEQGPGRGGGGSAGVGDGTGGRDVPAVDADRNLCQAVCSPEFYLIGCTMMIVGGAGMVVINNISQIVAAIPGTAAGDEDIFVTIISVSNCLGRLLAGWVSDLGVNRSGGRLPRPVFMGCACLLMGASFTLVAAWSSLTSLYVACVFIGIAYGAINCLNPAMSSELFGLKYMGSIYGGIGLFLVAGSFGLAHYTAGAFSDAFTNTSLGGNCLPSSHNGNGWDCFGYTFLVCVGACALGTAMMGVLTCRSRGLYMRKYAKAAQC